MVAEDEKLLCQVTWFCLDMEILVFCNWRKNVLLPLKFFVLASLKKAYVMCADGIPMACEIIENYEKNFHLSTTASCLEDPEAEEVTLTMTANYLWIRNKTLNIVYFQIFLSQLGKSRQKIQLCQIKKYHRLEHRRREIFFFNCMNIFLLDEIVQLKAWEKLGESK